MAPYIQHSLNTLKQNGLRITQPRKHVLHILDTASEPLSPYDIADIATKSGIPTDVVTVYRIFECLEKNGLIHRVLSSGKFVKCTVAPHTHHHQDHCCHHLAICDTCGTIREIHCHPKLTLPEIPDMTIIGHRLELIGRCRTCSETK